MINQNTRTIITKEQKQKALIAAMAIKIAKQLNDPMYNQYKTYRDKYLELKAALIAKYAPMAIRALKEKGHQINVQM